MPTLLTCIHCGREVLFNETIVGNAKDLGKGKCVCEACLPVYQTTKKFRPKHTLRKLFCFTTFALLAFGTVALLNSPTFRSAIHQKRTVWSKPGIRKAFVNAVRTLPEEIHKSGSAATVIPIRFPVGDRGTRIEAYAQMANSGHVKEISALLEKATDQPDVLREILSGISRSEKPEFVGIVRPYLSHPIPEIRAIAVLAFGKVGGPQNLPDIKDLSKDPNPIVRASAQMAAAALQSAAE